MENYASLMFTEAIQDLQEAAGTRDKYQTLYPHRRQDSLSANDIEFIRARDSFYIATISENGWPYIQHRGGAPGFVHVEGPTQLACADYLGNKQFISMGNLKTNPKVSLFFMDYMNHARLKIQGNATLIAVEDADPALVSQLDQRAAQAQRVLQINIIAMDWNCPKYIPTLYPRAIVENTINKLQVENAQLRQTIESMSKDQSER